MRTPSRTVKKVLQKQFPEYKFSVTTTKPQSRMARSRDDAYLNVSVILPIKLDTSTSLSISGTVKRFMNESEEIRGWGYSSSVGVRKKD